jgi:phage baseplate assembly protein W
MAIRDKYRKPFIEDNDTNIFIGVDLPIRIGIAKEGYFASTSTTIEAVKNNIRNLLNTNRGERLMQPNIGMNFKQLLFEPIGGEETLIIQDEILDALEFWLPFVEVRDIQIKNSANDSNIQPNTVSITIIFNIKQDPNTLASIQVSFEEDIGGATTFVGGGGY